MPLTLTPSYIARPMPVPVRAMPMAGTPQPPPPTAFPFTVPAPVPKVRPFLLPAVARMGQRAAFPPIIFTATPTTIDRVVEIAWDGVSWEDVSTDLIGPLDYHIGLDGPNALIDRAGPAKCSLVLRNDSGKYSPSNPDSPLYGEILLRRPIRVRYEGIVRVTRYSGFIKTIEADRQGNIPVARIDATDVLDLLVDQPLNAAAIAAGTGTGAVVAAILDAAGWSASLRDIDTGDGTVSAWGVPPTKKVVEALREIEDTELGHVYVDGEGVIVFEGHTRRATGVYLTSQATYSDAPGASLPYISIQSPNPVRYIVNRAQASVTPRTVQGLAVLCTLTGETPTIAHGQSITRVFEYPSPGSPNTAAWVNAWTTPNNTDITCSGVAYGDLAIVAVKYATRMIVTITNNHASATATITLWQARGTAVLNGTAVGYQADDATSQNIITGYGIKVYRNPGPWLPDTNTAQNYCDGIVATYKDPSPPVIITFLANLNLTLYADLLTRQISDRISVIGQEDRTALGIAGDYFIERMEDHCDIQSTRHEITLYCSLASAQAARWHLGTQALDVDAVLGF